MNTDTGFPGPVLHSVAFVHCSDASTLAMTVWLDPAETDRVRELLATLQAYGLILPAALGPLVQSCGFGEALAAIRGAVGAHFVDAAVGAAAGFGRGSDPDPAAVMAVWAFEKGDCGEDVLLGSARLWNSDFLLEALKIEDDDKPVPVPAVRDRYDRWVTAAGAGRLVRATRVPGFSGAYAIFAAAAPV